MTEISEKTKKELALARKEFKKEKFITHSELKTILDGKNKSIK